MAKASKRSYYAVRRGWRPGVYTSWKEVQKQLCVYPAGLFRRFETYEDAIMWAEAGGFFKSDTDIVEPWVILIRRYMITPRDRRDPMQEIADWENVRPGVIAETKPVLKAPNRNHAVEVLDADSTGPSSDPALTEEQQEVLDAVLSGRNFFFTGSAGTGKSVLLRAIVRAFKDKHAGSNERRDTALQRLKDQLRNGEISKDVYSISMDQAEFLTPQCNRWKLAVTASTGLAGLNIGGCTLHAWAGVGLGMRPKELLYKTMKGQRDVLHRWRTTSILIVDEVSMIDGNFLDKLEWLGRKIRENDKPFGGIQIIFSGDFFQLPPVPDSKAVDGNGLQVRPPYAFEAECWEAMIPRQNMLALSRVFRQRHSTFIDILEHMRRGNVSLDHNHLLQGLHRPIPIDNGTEPVELYPIKHAVNRVNDDRLDLLHTPSIEYVAHDEAGRDARGVPLTLDKAIALLDRNTRFESKIKLKVGAQVMLVMNLGDAALVNGSTGIIVDFVQHQNAAEYGAYLPPNKAGYAYPPDSTWPVVEFAYSQHSDQRQYRRVLVPYIGVSVENATEHPEATRYQVPLILAWAMTIHKSQGQSLDKVKIDLKAAFENGQTYVAISRATSLEGLQILNFASDKVMASEVVIEWMKKVKSRPSSPSTSVTRGTPESGNVADTTRKAEPDIDEEDGAWADLMSSIDMTNYDA